jgi:hypothetical protein
MKKIVFAFMILFVFLSASDLSGTSSLDGFYVDFSHDRPLGNSKFLYGHGLLKVHDDGYHVGYLQLGAGFHF